LLPEWQPGKLHFASIGSTSRLNEMLSGKAFEQETTGGVVSLFLQQTKKMTEPSMIPNVAFRIFI
jgi:hypothetical protein